MPLFRSRRDIEFVKKINRELIEHVIGDKITYYAISKELSQVNFYGEAEGKIFDPPVEMSALVEWLEQEVKTDTFGQDVVSKITVYLLEDYLKAISLQPREGDHVEFHNKFFEVTAIREPVQIFSKAGEPIGRVLECRTIRQNNFKPAISGTVDYPLPTWDEREDSEEPEVFYNRTRFPHTGSEPSHG